MYLLPQGFYDCLPEAFFNKSAIREKLTKLFNSHGYLTADTSAFEPYDGYRELTEKEESRRLIKSVDRDGDILVLKNDMNVSLTRLVATKLYNREFPLRLAYSSKVYGDGGKVERERELAGIRLFGERGVEGDAEIVALAVESVIKLGITDFRIEMGNSGILGGILNKAQIPAHIQKSLKLDVNLKGLLATDNVDKDTLQLIDEISSMYGDVRVLEEASNALIENRESLDGLVALYQTNQILEEYGLDGYVRFNIGLSGSKSYYDGTVFRIIVKNNEEPLVEGGRADGLSLKFGRDIPSVGFSVDLEAAVRILEKAGVPKILPVPSVVIGVIDRCTCLGVAKKTAENLIEQGFSVIFRYKADAAETAAYARGCGATVAFYVNRLGKVEEVSL